MPRYFIGTLKSVYGLTSRDLRGLDKSSGKYSRLEWMEDLDDAVVGAVAEAETGTAVRRVFLIKRES